MINDLPSSDTVTPTRRGLIAAASLLPLGATALAAGIKDDVVPRPGQTRPPGQVKPDYVLNIVNKTVNPLQSKGGDPYPAVLADGLLPGTELRFREGENFRVLVNNRLMEPTTVHWHGMLVPNLQDGVPDITQAPI